MTCREMSNRRCTLSGRFCSGNNLQCTNYIERNDDMAITNTVNNCIATTSQERREVLNTVGINTSKHFDVFIDRDIPQGSTIRINVMTQADTATQSDSVLDEIIANGYVKNTKLHRRWIMAQVMRIMNSDLTFSGYLDKHYSYNYMFDMTLEELRVLGILEKEYEQGEDEGTFKERRHFFTKNVVIGIMENYRQKLIKCIDNSPRKMIEGKEKIQCEPYCYIYTEEDVLYDTMINPIARFVSQIYSSTTYTSMANIFKQFKTHYCDRYRLPNDTKKPTIWKEAFKGAGAYYTLKNMVMFHDVLLSTNEGMFTREGSIQFLQNKLGEYEGYQYLAVLRKTITDNNFDFIRSIAEHQKTVA